MSPIRVALAGLSSNSLSSWAATAHLPYLLSARGRAEYEITALLNSSVEAATNARSHFDLPSSVQTYGDPEALASDPNVDLVVCCTFVGHHFSTVAPSLKAGKRVFVEWPLTTNLTEALELQRLAATPEIWETCIVGLQGRASPPIEKMKELLRGHVIGKVLSSEVQASLRLLPVPPGTLPQAATFMADKTKGANAVAVGYGHMIDFVHAVLGEWDECQARTQIQTPELALLGVEPRSVVTSDVPDLIVAHGKLRGSDYVHGGATLAIGWRDGTPPFKDTPALVWTINGEKGAIRLTSLKTPLLGADSSSDSVSLKVHIRATDEIEDVSWDWKDWQLDLPEMGRNTATLYERYASWIRDGHNSGVEGEGLATFNDALARAKEIDQLL